MKLVYIKWVDSKNGPEGWEYLDGLEPLKPILCSSVGFLIDDNKDYKTIAPTIGGGQVLGRITIPSYTIKKIIYLKIPELQSVKPLEK